MNSTSAIDTTISPANISYDLDSPGDISTAIIWNLSTAVTGVVYDGTPLETPDAYTVGGDTLIIKRNYLEAQSFTAGDTAEFTISFDKGNSATLTINIINSYTPGSNGRSGGGGGYTPVSSIADISTDKQPNAPATAKMSIPGTVQDNVLSVTITEQMAADAIKAAQDAAKKSGKEADGIALEFDITSGGYTVLNATIDAGAVDRLKEAGARFVKIGSAVLDVTLDTNTIAEIDKQSTGPATVSAKAPTKLSDAAKALIGSRPVFNITVSYQKSGKTEYVTSFGKGVATLGIAYKAAAKEKTGNVFGVYVDRNGKPQPLVNSRYDSGRVIFGRNSLSTYGVGYTPAPEFTDTANHWAKESIDFVTSYSLISGTSETSFSPDIAITRAEFLMALGRLSGADVSGYETSGFTDVGSDSPAMPYIEWAVKDKIVQGIGNGKFGPGQQISRQDMAVMMQNYAKAAGYKLPVSVAAATFSDHGKIAVYAKDAVTVIQQAGIMQGKGNNAFDPAGKITRAEASVILRRFVELVGR